MSTGKIFIYPNQPVVVPPFDTRYNYGRQFANIVGQANSLSETCPKYYADATTPLQNVLANPNATTATYKESKDIGSYIKKNRHGNSDINIEEGIAQPQVLKALVGSSASTNFPAAAGDGILLYSSLGIKNQLCPDSIDVWTNLSGIFAFDILSFQLGESRNVITDFSGFTSFNLDSNGAIISVNYNTATLDAFSNSYINIQTITPAQNTLSKVSMINNLYPFQSTTQGKHMLIVARYLATPTTTAATVTNGIVQIPAGSDEVRCIIHRKETEAVIN